jgi:hypothetical protein
VSDDVGPERQSIHLTQRRCRAFQLIMPMT